MTTEQVSEPTRRRGRPRSNSEAGSIPTAPEYAQIEETEEPTSSGIKIWASLGATINMGNYESQKLEIGVSGIPIDASEEYIQAQVQIATQKLHTTVDILAQEMGRRLKEDYGR